MLSAWQTLGGEPAAPLRLRQRLVAAYLEGPGRSFLGQPEEEGGGDEDLDAEPPTEPIGLRLLDLLAVLSPEDRAVLVSRYYFGLSAAEIGEILGTDARKVATAEGMALATLRWVR
jgi:DNA-directed RNA polymerase specialized sigma24 family protein